MLLPLSGTNAALGRSMARAAALAQGLEKKALLTFDSGGTPEGAATAARMAVKQGAALLAGPLLSAETRAVLPVAGGVPVVSFSNDLALLESGAFLLGITADQAVAPLLHYARDRGVRRIGIAADDSPWGAQIVAAARRAADREGLTLAPGKDTGDALLCGGDLAHMAAIAKDLAGNGVQLLGAFSGIDPDPTLLGPLEGAWLSAPDPAPFADFAARFEAQVGSPPGIIAGLAYDAAGIVAALRKTGGIDRPALLNPVGFPGVCGAVRFRDDGSAQRTMAILVVEQGRFRVVQGTGA